MTILSTCKQISMDYGGKINGLIRLQGLGYNVPEGVIIPESVLSNIWSREILKNYERDVWHTLTPEIVLVCLKDLKLSEDLDKQIQQLSKNGKTYIVRSSSLVEDGEFFSFAGQYESFGQCMTYDDILFAIKKCIASLFSKKLDVYSDGVDDTQRYRLALLIQEELIADFSGVCFTTAPQGETDTAMLVEVVKGHGRYLVDGNKVAHSIILNWFTPDFQDTILTNKQQQQLHQMALNVMVSFQRPMDVEFSIVNEQLYLLQARPITKLNIQIKKGMWTNTNFRDGGVSSQSCPPLMRALYERVWQNTLSKFMIDAGLFKSNEIEKLSQVQFARLYWNLSQVKKGMLKIPGFIESDFDDELGVDKYYNGKGRITSWNIKNTLYLLKIARRISKMVSKHRRVVYQQYQEGKQVLQELNEQLDNNIDTTSLEKMFHDIVFRIHFKHESLYFWQVYINTVLLAMKKTFLLKHMTVETFFTLIDNLGDITHLEPMKEIVKIAESDDKEALFSKFQLKFGYHSSRELDLLTASYEEDMTPIKEQVEFLSNDLKSLNAFKEKLYRKTDSTIVERTLRQLNPYIRYRARKNILQLRELLKERELLKDLSTHTYHIVRKVALLLGQRYVDEGVLSSKEDMIFLSPNDLEDKSLWREKVSNERVYYNAYHLFKAPNDLFEEQVNTESVIVKSSISGRGANRGIVTAKVRIVNNSNDLQLIQDGEILVAQFTDTGFSYVFGRIAGLITETGGVLCHASIVARECGIPAIVCVKDATKLLKTGMIVSMNGHTGEIMIVED